MSMSSIRNHESSGVNFKITVFFRFTYESNIQTEQKTRTIRNLQLSISPNVILPYFGCK